MGKDPLATIVKKLRRYGISVKETKEVGKGFPELLIGYNGHNILIQINKEDIGIDELKFRTGWKGSYKIAFPSIKDILNVIGVENVKRIRGGMD